MSSIRTTVHESLPYVDPEPTTTERQAAESLITQEALSTPPPQPTTLPEPNFTPRIQAELQRIATKQPLTAIDLTRYEALAETPPSDPTTLQTQLSRAYAAASYLSSRHAHLQLLDAYGRNAWLVGNWQLEGELKALEKELEETKREVDLVNIQRRRAQDEVGGELSGLNDTWRRGVGRVLETEVATESLRRQILEKQRGG